MNGGLLFCFFLPAQTCLFRVPRHDRLSVGRSDNFQAHTDICMNEKLQKKRKRKIDWFGVEGPRRPSRQLQTKVPKFHSYTILFNNICIFLNGRKSSFLPSLTLSDFYQLCLSALYSHIFWFLWIILWGERDPIQINLIQNNIRADKAMHDAD